jgi:3-oxoacyl-[acyl-carrier protein] reductase
MNENIIGKVALVTGGSKGIGAAISCMLVENGISRLLLLARRSAEYEELVCRLNELKSENQTVEAYMVDLSNSIELQGFINNLLSKKINIDILVNNAGLTIPKTVFEANIEELMATMQVNLYTPFLLIQTLLRQGNKFSHIVNIASTAGIKGRAGWSTYSSSKAALISFSQALREELLPLGSRVICISPGRCATALRKVLAPDEDQATIMQPQQVANIIRILLSDEGQFIDSENIVVRF